MGARNFLNSDSFPLLYTSRTADFKRVIPISSPWHSAVILDVLAQSGFTEDNSLVKANLYYLIKTMSVNREWKFIYHPSYTIPADSDDTACSLIALHQYAVTNLDYKSATSNLLRYRNDRGIFYTWLGDDKHNEIDLVVNANIFRWFMIQNHYLEDVDSFLVEYFLEESNYVRYILYYDSPTIIRYFLTKALKYSRKISCKELKDLILAPLINYYKVEIVSSPLKIAMMSSILSMLNFKTKANDYLIQLLRRSQRENGSWNASSLIIVPSFVPGGPYYGASDALTTAFCLEALSLYSRKSQKNDINEDP